MAQVIVLISTLMLADMRDGKATDASVAELLREMDRFGVEVNYETATPDSNRPDAMYLTFSLKDQAHEFAGSIRNIEGVLSAYVKPGEALP